MSQNQKVSKSRDLRAKLFSVSKNSLISVSIGMEILMNYVERRGFLLSQNFRIDGNHQILAEMRNYGGIFENRISHPLNIVS